MQHGTGGQWGGKPTTTSNQVLCVEKLSSHPDIDNEFGTNILGSIINAENLMATMGNDILGTPANADNIMATTTDELSNGLFDDMSVNRGGQ